MLRASLFLSLLATSLIPACASSPASDELSGESSQDGEAGKGDAAAAFTYYEVTADLRACSLNTVNCGGFYVSRPNRATTQCGRGVAQERCYVGTLDFVPTAMPASVADSYKQRIRAGEIMVVRGTLDPGADDRPVLRGSEIWVGNAQEPGDGVFALVHDNGIRCVRAPCPSLSERKLNSTLGGNITGVDFDASGATRGEIELARNDLYGNGVIVVGYRDYDSLGGKTRSANTFYTRAPVPLR